jgi:hypothetical protein
MMKNLNFKYLKMSLRARNERGNLVAVQGENALLRDCFVPRNDKFFSGFRPLIYFCLSTALLLSSCGGADKSASGDDDKAVNAQTPVTVAAVGDSSMVDYTTLNAT